MNDCVIAHTFYSTNVDVILVHTQARAVRSNLTDAHNTFLRNRLFRGRIRPADLATMTHEDMVEPYLFQAFLLP
jgi:hypothetical protein